MQCEQRATAPRCAVSVLKIKLPAADGDSARHETFTIENRIQVIRNVCAEKPVQGETYTLHSKRYSVKSNAFAEPSNSPCSGGGRSMRERKRTGRTA